MICIIAFSEKGRIRSRFSVTGDNHGEGVGVGATSLLFDSLFKYIYRSKEYRNCDLLLLLLPVVVAVVLLLPIRR